MTTHTTPSLSVLPVHITDLYCFSFTSDEGQLKESGWEYFKLESEFKRMRVPNENWTLYDQTLSYEVGSIQWPSKNNSLIEFSIAFFN